MKIYLLTNGKPEGCHAEVLGIFSQKRKATTERERIKALMKAKKISNRNKMLITQYEINKEIISLYFMYLDEN